MFSVFGRLERVVYKFNCFGYGCICGKIQEEFCKENIDNFDMAEYVCGAEWNKLFKGIARGTWKNGTGKINIESH